MAPGHQAGGSAIFREVASVPLQVSYRSVSEDLSPCIADRDFSATLRVFLLHRRSLEVGTVVGLDFISS